MEKKNSIARLRRKNCICLCFSGFPFTNYLKVSIKWWHYDTVVFLENNEIAINEIFQLHVFLFIGPFKSFSEKFRRICKFYSKNCLTFDESSTALLLYQQSTTTCLLSPCSIVTSVSIVNLQFPMASSITHSCLYKSILQPYFSSLV